MVRPNHLALVKDDLVTKYLRGLKTAWYQTGSATGPIILFLHGFPDTPKIWEYQEAELRNSFQVICPYVRGVLASEEGSDRARYGCDSLSLDVLEILNFVDPEGKRKVVLVGHDLGSVVAWNVASLLGSRLSGLVILNGLSLRQMASRFKAPMQILKSWYIYLIQIPVFSDAVVANLPQKFWQNIYRSNGLHGSHIPTWELDRKSLMSFLRQYRAFAADIPKMLRRKLPRIQAPVLILFGKNDPYILAPTEEEISHDAADFQIRILDGGHWVYRQHSEAINGILTTWLKERVVNESSA